MLLNNAVRNDAPRRIHYLRGFIGQRPRRPNGDAATILRANIHGRGLGGQDSGAAGD